MIHVLNLTYLAPAESRKAHLSERKEWLRNRYNHGQILLSGPRPGGAVVVTADLTEDEAVALAESDPWHQHRVTSYELLSFEGRNASPGVATAPATDPSVFLINVAETPDAGSSVDSLAIAVDHVAATAEGFRGSRLLTSVEGDAIVNMASWTSEKEFAAIFDDPEFIRLYGSFKETVTDSKYRLYRTSRVIGPNR